MKILNNLKQNHYSHIMNILTGSDELLLVSPFLMDNFEEFLYEVKGAGIKKISLVTTLKDNDPDLFRKVDSLYSFGFRCLEDNIEPEIRIDNRLHGKIYISLRNGCTVKGIITSANLTNMGLKGNHEWGVLIEDSEELASVVKDVYNVSSYPMTQKDLAEVIRLIDSYLKNNVESTEPKIKLEIHKYIRFKEPEKVLGENKRYFLKPLGATEMPFTEERKLSRTIQTIQFSTRRPRAVRTGDILICYAVGTALQLLGYFEVLNDPIRIEEDSERWPWQVEAKNLCPDYSDNWYKFNKTISDSVDAYPENIPLTAVGRRSMGSLQWGSDKLELDLKFAKHVIKIIEKSVE